MQSQIENNSQFGTRVVGYLDDNTAVDPLPEDILGPVEEAKTIIETLGVNDVVIALPQREYEHIDVLVSELHTLPVKVWIILDYFHLAIHKAQIEDFSGSLNCLQGHTIYPSHAPRRTGVELSEYY